MSCQDGVVYKGCLVFVVPLHLAIGNTVSTRSFFCLRSHVSGVRGENRRRNRKITYIGGQARTEASARDHSSN